MNVNLEQFAETYREELARAVAQYPDEYPWAHEDTVIVGNLGNTVFPRRTVEEVASRMIARVAEGDGYSKDGRAFKATCKRLGIPFTYKAIRAYVGEVVTV